MLQHKMDSSSHHIPHQVNSLDVILNYQNTDVVLKFRKEWDVSPEEADELFIEMKKFLWLAAMSLNDCANITVHQQFHIIDEMWHTFIQFTDAYSNFCEEYLGGFLHHFPMTNDMIQKEMRHVNQTGITYREYRFKEYTDQLQRIETLLGAESVLKWYGEYAVKYSVLNLNRLRKPIESINDPTYADTIAPLLNLPADKFLKTIMKVTVWTLPASVCGCSGKGCGAGCSCNSR